MPWPRLAREVSRAVSQAAQIVHLLGCEQVGWNRSNLRCLAGCEPSRTGGGFREHPVFRRDGREPTIGGFRGEILPADSGSPDQRRRRRWRAAAELREEQAKRMRQRIRVKQNDVPRAVRSADAQIVDSLERGSAAAADEGGAIAAYQRIGHRVRAARAIKFGGGIFRHRFANPAPRSYLITALLTAAGASGAAACATTSARAFRNTSYWPIRSRNTASPSILYPGMVKCT